MFIFLATALGQEEEATVKDMEDILLFVQEAKEAASQFPASSAALSTSSNAPLCPDRGG